MFLDTTSHRANAARNVLDHVGLVFPRQSEARTLKDAMLGLNGTSLLGMTAVQAFYFLSYKQNATTYGVPSGDLIGNAAQSWASSANILTAAAMRLLERDDIDHDNVIDALTQGVNIATVIAAGQHNDQFLRRLWLAKPDLLGREAIKELDPAQLAVLATSMPNDERVVATALDSLFEIDNDAVAGIFAGRFPKQVCLKVFHSLANSLAGDEREVPKAWMSSIRDYLYSASLNDIFDRIEKQSEMAACALALQLNVRAALRRSSAEWTKKLVHSLPDLEGTSRQRLFAFLVALALAQPEAGCEKIFEGCFDAVHEDIAVSRLPYDAFNVLAEYLPQLYYRDQWGTCLRLRLAVVSTYVKEGLSLKSFGMLSKDSTIQGWLVELAKKSFQGRQYLKGR